MTKVHCVTVLIVDHDQLGADGVRAEMEAVNYPNDCIHPHVLDVETREVEWDDDHPLNNRRTMREAVAALFAKKGPEGA